MKKQFSNILVGGLLILVGALMILDKMHILDFGWYEFYPLALLVISIINFIKFANGHKNSIFWGTSCGILGVFFVLRNFDITDILWQADTWPIFMLAFGIAFLVMYLLNPSDWGVLVPGTILTFFSIVFLVDSFGFDFDVFDFVSDFWPIVLVLIGAGLVIKSFSDKKQNFSN